MRDDLLIARDEFIFMKIAELEEFISEKQPDDETHHQLVLLQAHSPRSGRKII
jgi:hypothetical protein